MDSFQTRRANTQSPLTKRISVPRAPQGGRFVAHGVAPSSFMPMPAPRPMSQPPVRNLPRGRGVSVKLSPAQRNDEYQARERPTGFVVGQRCSWCLTPFDDQRTFSSHRHICSNRPGGPLLIETTRQPTIGISCACRDCGEAFISRGQRAEHIRERKCPMDIRPSMCRKCGMWLTRCTDRLDHENQCCKSGAD